MSFRHFSWSVTGCSVLQLIFVCFSNCHADLIPTPVLRQRSPPSHPPVSIVPQTALETGVQQTVYVSNENLNANSVVTQTLSGTPTVLPLWYCGPSETAAACKGCPSATTTGLPACTSGFQGLYLVPIGLPIVGGIIPPPAGLPTLTIGPDGNPTAKTTDQPPTEVPTTVLTTTTTTTEPWSVDAACKSPVLKAADHALDPLPQITSPPSPPPPNPAKSDSPTPSDLPVPMLPVEDPKNPQWWLGCGPFAVDPYFKNTFYQFGASFSKADAYNVIDQFCKENVERKRVIGKAGNHPVDKPDLKALPYVEKSYDTPGGSGKLQVRIQVDTDNKNRQGEKCPIDDVFSFEGDGAYGNCRQILGQTIEFCNQDNHKKNNDITWKEGGTVLIRCSFWTLIKTPPDRENDEQPPYCPDAPPAARLFNHC